MSLLLLFNSHRAVAFEEVSYPSGSGGGGLIDAYPQAPPAKPEVPSKKKKRPTKVTVFKEKPLDPIEVRELALKTLSSSSLKRKFREDEISIPEFHKELKREAEKGQAIKKATFLNYDDEILLLLIED